MRCIFFIRKHSDNKLRSVPSDSLKDLSNLRVVLLNGNSIQKIETDAFRELKQIKDIQVGLDPQ